MYENLPLWGQWPISIKEYQVFPKIFFLLHCVPLYVCRLCINFQELCARLLGMATLRIRFSPSFHASLIDFLSIRKVIGRAKRAPHWGVQSRFRVIYIYMLSVCLVCQITWNHVNQTRACSNSVLGSKIRPVTPIFFVSSIR